MSNYAKILTYLFFLIVQYTAAQDGLFILKYPSEKEINVSVKAKVFNVKLGFVYEYQILSLESSKQSVWEFSIAHCTNVDSLKSPVGWEVNIAPVPFKRIAWASIDSVNDISPGQNLSGFIYFSQGLPSIRNFYATGWVEPPLVDVEPDSIIGGVFPENSFCGKTIGPGDFQNSISTLTFLDTLTSYTRQSLELGWIKSRTIAKKYLSYFNIAKTNLEQNNFYTVKAILKEVLREVDKDSTNTITSEAYALLRYNTEYLIEQISEPSQMTVQELIDALIAQLKWTYDNKQLGDRTFYKELDTHLREAKRFYEKKRYNKMRTGNREILYDDTKGI